VAENQKLMQIPDLKHMFVNAKIHEALVGRVHKGQPATVRVDATGNRKLQARVESVANTPSQQDWFAADVKVYATKVAIVEEVDGLKPGMNSEVTITVDDALPHVLSVPITAIVGSAELGAKRTCFVLTAAGPEAREIEIGMSNEKDAEVCSGLKEGEDVVINPNVLVRNKAKTREAGEFSKKETNGGDSYKNGKGGPQGKGAAPGMTPGGRGGLGPQAGGPAGPGGGSPGGRGQGGPGGPGAGKGDGAGGGFPQPTAEQRQQWQKQEKEFKDKYDKAKSKEEKKKLVKERLDATPEQARDFVKQRMKGQGYDVGD